MGRLVTGQPARVCHSRRNTSVSVSISVVVKHLPLNLAALVAVRARPHLPLEELKRDDGRRTCG